MKIASLMLALAGALCLTGCSDLVSMEPFVTEKQSVADPNLAGTWKTNDKDLFIVEQNGSQYTITYTSKEGSTKFDALLLRVGDAEILDIVPSDSGILQIPVHAAVRVWPSGNELQWKFLDSKWLREQASSLLLSRPNEHGTLLLAPGEAVHNFLVKYAADAKAYEGEVSVLTRVQ